MNAKDIPRKANRVLYLITVSLLLIFVRVWYLQTIARPEHVKRARTPRERMLVLKPTRGPIYDRFGVPMAINRIQYNACVCFNPMREIPFVKWVPDERGKRRKTYLRRAYIKRLSETLSSELGLDTQDIEDIIYSRSAIFPNTHHVIKADIDERTYARLKMLERDFPGLVAECGTKRAYPQGKVGSDIIGYLGAINQRQVSSIAGELRALETFLKAREDGLPVFLPKGYSNAEQVKNHFDTLKQQAYSINALVGRAGIEHQYDQELRGICGKQAVELDVRGQLVRKLPGNQPPLPGKTLTLSLSAELQEYAEQLLTITEEARDKNFAQAGKDHGSIQGPWIKGGAVVVLEPTSGDVIAMANYPRFDPNDFIEKKPKISQWLETSNYISGVWDGTRTLEKELFDEKAKCFSLDARKLTWEAFLDMVLSKHSHVKRGISRIRTLQVAFAIQECVDYLLHFSGQDNVACLINALYPHHPQARGLDPSEEIIDRLKAHDQLRLIKARLNEHLQSITHNDDKLLFLDLLRLNANRAHFTKPLINALGSFSLAAHRDTNQAVARLLISAKSIAQDTFHRTTFANWRGEHFAAFLKEKRRQEKLDKTYAKPYLDYLQTEEKKQFVAFWDAHRYALLDALIRTSNDHLSDDLKTHYEALLSLDSSMHTSLEKVRKRYELLGDLGFTYLHTLRTCADLTEPLWGKYRFVKSNELKGLAAAFYPPSSFGYGKSHAYRRSAPPGSVFKVATMYSGLKQRYQTLDQKHPSLSQLNPMTLFDETCPGSVLGHFPNGNVIPRMYKGGRLPRSHGRIGKVDIMSAMERSSNVYFAVLAGDYLTSPNDLLSAAKDLGYGAKTGIDLPGEYAGVLPTDLMDNRTGLYSFAIGQHTFDGTPLQTAIMLSAIANEGRVYKPHLLKSLDGHELMTDKTPLNQRNFPYREALEGVGVHFPLFSKTLSQSATTKIRNPRQTLMREIFMPPAVRNHMIESLHNVVNGPMGSARPSRIKALYQHNGWKHAYSQIRGDLLGKTSTSEFYYRPTLEKESPLLKCKHAWFSCIAMDENQNPELVIVIYLRFADYGKEAAPLAALLVKKWRELSQKYQHLTIAENN